MFRVRLLIARDGIIIRIEEYNGNDIVREKTRTGRKELYILQW